MPEPCAGRGPADRVRARAVCLGPTERAVMTALLFNVGEASTLEEVTGLVWPAGREPKNPSHAIQTHVMRLRQHLGPDLIETTAHAYRACVERDAVDVFRFCKFITRAEASLRAVDLPAAERSYSEALTHCGRGEPWYDLRDSPVAAGERARLTELRLVAEERRATLALMLDRLPVGELERLTTEQPLRETRWAVLMQAQAMHGRQADALRSFTRARLALQELGIEPSPALREMERRVLIQDASLQDPAEARNHLNDHYA